ncbi:MAG: DUF4384 domain-containing protein [Burkholderiales bacterium]|nr:MAG: DUF4384 domain-containing protein [Burkholderiales bacterium]CAG0966924.1 hypothetical protein MYXO_01078 [Myxococcaceae bacterium]
MLRKVRMLLALPLLFLASACVTTEDSVKREASDVTEKIRKGPEQAPLRTITNFTDGLRCMDNLFMMYGIRDVVVISEDLEDKTKKVSAGTKDMMTSAIQGMSRRSRAIRMIAYGSDSGNVIGILKEMERKVNVMPQFGIRGSVSQLDENVAKKVEGGGIAIEPFIGIGRAAVASTTILGIDLQILSTQDLSIVPGVVSSNSVAIFRSGAGLEAEAGYKKFGINYQQNLSKNEGTAQALRTLVELAAIELFGRLTKVPYWLCINGTTNDEGVKTEISDWYTGMFAEAGEFVGYWQLQMRLRGLYQGEVNGVPDENLTKAIMAYREALGMEKNAKLDLAFFTAYLNANHYESAPKAQEVLARAPAAAAEAAAKAVAEKKPLGLKLVSLKGNNLFVKGEEIKLNVQPSKDAYVYCFMQDETKAIQRFFPNRFQRDALISGAKGLDLPGTQKFKINANTKGLQETIACYATARDVFADLPPSVGSGDFETLGAKSLNDIKAAFDKVAGNAVAAANFTVRVR